MVGDITILAAGFVEDQEWLWCLQGLGRSVHGSNLFPKIDPSAEYLRKQSKAHFYAAWKEVDPTLLKNVKITASASNGFVGDAE